MTSFSRISSIFDKRTRNHSQVRQLRAESLETRDLMAITLVDGILTIEGTDAVNEASVTDWGSGNVRAAQVTVSPYGPGIGILESRVLHARRRHRSPAETV